MHKKPADLEQKHEALQAKIFSSVAHDIRTPLACIIGSLQTLDQMNSKLSPTQRDMLIKIALAEAQRLDGLLTERLDEAKPE